MPPNPAEAALAAARDLLDAYRRRDMVRAQIATLTLEVAQYEALLAPRANDPMFMALLALLAGDSGLPALAPSSAVRVEESRQSRSVDTRKVFAEGYGLGEAAAKEGKPRDLEGLQKGWRLKGFRMAYDRIKAGKPLDLASDSAAIFDAAGEGAESEGAGVATGPSAGGTVETAPAADGVDPEDSGFVPEDGVGEDPFSGLDAEVARLDSSETRSDAPRTLFPNS